MQQEWSRRERFLLAVVGLSAFVLLTDIIVSNVVGDLPSGWWPVPVPVGLFLIPVIGAVALILLITERQRDDTTL